MARVYSTPTTDDGLAPQENIMAQARTDWKGVFTPIVTPFTPDGAFD